MLGEKEKENEEKEEEEKKEEKKCYFSFFFHSFTVHLDIIMSLFIQLNAQLDCSRNVKSYIKI